MANKPGINNLFNIFEGMNAFGAGPGARTRSLLDSNLITQDAIDKANRQSIGTGIVTGLASYLAQPKNKGYGSAVPYLAQSYLQANKAAQAPFQGVADQYLMDTQLKEQQRVLGERTKTQGVIDKMIASDPNLEYLRNSPLAQQITAINENTKLKMTPAKDGLNLAKLNPKDFTRDSWAAYTTNGDTRVLNGITQEIQNNIDAHNAKMLYEYGVIDNKNNPQSNTQNRPQEKAEQGFRFGNNNIPNHPSNVTLSNGDVVTPRLYKQMGEKFRLPLQAEKNQVGSQNRANIELMRQHRNLLRNFIASGGHKAVTGMIDANTIALSGSNKEDMRKQLFTIVQKEFLNNYSSVKATGGGFGALSEREGERLEAMGFNLSDEQSPEKLLENLMALDASLAKSEQRLIDGYSMEYGAMEGFNPLELQGFDSTPNDSSDDDALVNKYISG
jgi:hypothetical protein